MKKLITAALLIATVAAAQKSHNQYEPPNAPGAGQKLLAHFAGNWEVVKTFFPMNGKPIVNERRMQAIHGSKWQVSRVGFYFLRF